MKLVFWITGAPCSGKSFHAIKMGERLNLPVYHLDLIDDRTNIDDMTKEEGYRNILKNLEENIIIEGIIPFTFKRDMEIVQRILSDYKIIYCITQKEKIFTWDHADFIFQQKNYLKNGYLNILKVLNV